MSLSHLKSDWQKAGRSEKNESELLLMTRVSNHPALKKIRRKLIIETIGVIFLLVIYNDWFDGDKKPFYANVLLIAGALCYILNDIIGYISIAKPIHGKNLKTSIENYLAKIRRLSVLSLIISFTYSASFIVFFTSVITFTTEKYLLLAGIIITLIVTTYISYRMWIKRITQLKNQTKEFNLED
jgi:hypothetical protein